MNFNIVRDENGRQGTFNEELWESYCFVQDSKGAGNSRTMVSITRQGNK
jgi:hypothetical protein